MMPVSHAEDQKSWTEGMEQQLGAIIYFIQLYLTEAGSLWTKMLHVLFAVERVSAHCTSSRQMTDPAGAVCN